MLHPQIVFYGGVENTICPTHQMLHHRNRIKCPKYILKTLLKSPFPPEIRFHLDISFCSGNTGTDVVNDQKALQDDSPLNKRKPIGLWIHDSRICSDRPYGVTCAPYCTSDIRAYVRSTARYYRLPRLQPMHFHSSLHFSSSLYRTSSMHTSCLLLTAPHNDQHCRRDIHVILSTTTRQCEKSAQPVVGQHV